MPEMETAIRDEIVVVERAGYDGRPALFTASSIGPPSRSEARDDGRFWLIQLSVPLANLQRVIWERWLLLAVLALVLAVTLAAALLMARSREIPGHGLGLSIVKSIIEMYGGTIAISSAGKDRGTSVTLHFPHSNAPGSHLPD